MTVPNQRPRTNTSPPKKEPALITALMHASCLISTPRRCFFITHGPFREISIAQLSGDYLPLSLVLEQVIKIGNMAHFHCSRKIPHSRSSMIWASTGIVLTLFCDIIQQWYHSTCSGQSSFLYYARAGWVADLVCTTYCYCDSTNIEMTARGDPSLYSVEYS